MHFHEAAALAQLDGKHLLQSGLSHSRQDIDENLFLCSNDVVAGSACSKSNQIWVDDPRRRGF